MNGFAALALTKLDILSGLEELKIGVAYKDENGVTFNHYPSSEQELSSVSVEYLNMPGWKQDITTVRKFEDLPLQAQNYVTKIEEILKVPIRWVGVGPSREQMIERQ